jgi:hypothetical protein
LDEKCRGQVLELRWEVDVEGDGSGSIGDVNGSGSIGDVNGSGGIGDVNGSGSIGRWVERVVTMEEEQRHPALLRHANGYKDDGEDEEGAITGADGKGGREGRAGRGKMRLAQKVIGAVLLIMLIQWGVQSMGAPCWEGAEEGIREEGHPGAGEKQQGASRGEGGGR